MILEGIITGYIDCIYCWDFKRNFISEGINNLSIIIGIYIIRTSSSKSTGVYILNELPYIMIFGHIFVTALNFILIQKADQYGKILFILKIIKIE